MQRSPVDFLLNDDAVLVPLESLVRLKRSGSRLLFEGAGRYCTVSRQIRSHMGQGSGAAFYAQSWSDERRRLWLSLDVLSPTAFRLQMGERPPDARATNAMTVGNLRRPLRLKVHKRGGQWTVHTGAMTIVVSADPFRLTVWGPDGVACARVGGPQASRFGQFDAVPTGLILSANGTKATSSLTLEHDEKILGMGERFSGMNRRGQTLTNWSHDGLGNSAPRCYKPIPFLVSSKGYGLFINTASRFEAFIGSHSHCEATFVIDDDALDHYFFYGPRLTGVLEQYTRLTGRAALPPRWSFGLWLGRDPWKDWSQVEREIRRFEKEQLPLEVVNFNEIWMGIPDDDDKVDCNFRFDTKGFMTPGNLAARLKRHRLRCSLWQLPYLGHGSTAFEQAQKAGAVVKAVSHGAPPREIGVIDFSDRRAVRWYQQQITRLLRGGADAIKVDFGETSPANVAFRHLDGAQMHNLMALLYNKAAFDATVKVRGRGDSLIWSRPAYAGSQRYPVHWSGDPDATWHGLSGCLKGGLSLALCGFSFWSNDLGGYLGDPTPELYMRWTQMAMLCSHVRAHGAGPREPWHYGKEAVRNFRTYLRLRYSLLPYIYSEAAHAAARGLPLLRPLVLDYQDDPTVYHIEDQFLFGRDILVAPVVTEGARSRDIYLPRGEWVDHWNAEVLTGPAWVRRDCPLAVMPLYVRRGALVATEPINTRVRAGRVQDLKLVLYPHGPTVQRTTETARFFDGQHRHPLNVRYSSNCIEVIAPKALEVRELVAAGQSCGRAVRLRMRDN